MSDFVNRLLPLLPKSLRYEEVAEAASHLNRLAGQLSNSKYYSEEHELVLQAWNDAKSNLSSLSSHSELNELILFDYLTVIIYLRSIDHGTTSDDPIDLVSWISQLINSSSITCQRLASLAARLPEYAHNNEASLIFSNTIAKVKPEHHYL